MVGRAWQRISCLLLGGGLWGIAAPGATAPAPITASKPVGARPPAKQTVAPPAKPSKPAISKVAVSGQVQARIRGETSPIVVMGDLRHLDLILERPSLSQGLVRIHGRTDARGMFSIPDVPAGKYTVRVRIPEMPLERDMGELYRAEVEITPQRPFLQVQMPYLVMRAVEPNGAAAAWDRLVVKVRREGGELKQTWNLVFQKEPGANPQGPVEEKGGITIHVEKEMGQVSFGYSWSTKDKNLLMFPVVEEDAQVRYYMTLSIPQRQCGYRRFAGRRGQSPGELEFLMEPFHRVQGRISLEGIEAPLPQARVNLTVYDPADKTPIHVRAVTPNAEGHYVFDEVPPGLAWVAVSLQGTAGEQQNVPYSAAEWLTLGVKPRAGGDAGALNLVVSPESARGTAGRFQAMQRFKPAPEPPRPSSPEKNPLAPAA